MLCIYTYIVENKIIKLLLEKSYSYVSAANLEPEDVYNLRRQMI